MVGMTRNDDLYDTLNAVHPRLSAFHSRIVQGFNAPEIYMYTNGKDW